MITVYNYKSVDVASLMATSHSTYLMDIMQSKGSTLGNPFYNRSDLSRAQRIEHFRSWLGEQLYTNIKVREVIYHLTTLHAQNINIALMCCCKPKPCHGDVIKSYIEAAIGDILGG